MKKNNVLWHFWFSFYFKSYSINFTKTILWISQWKKNRMLLEFFSKQKKMFCWHVMLTLLPRRLIDAKDTVISKSVDDVSSFSFSRLFFPLVLTSIDVRIHRWSDRTSALSVRLCLLLRSYQFHFFHHHFVEFPRHWFALIWSEFDLIISTMRCDADADADSDELWDAIQNLWWNFLKFYRKKKQIVSNKSNCAEDKSSNRKEWVFKQLWFEQIELKMHENQILPLTQLQATVRAVTWTNLTSVAPLHTDKYDIDRLNLLHC